MKKQILSTLCSAIIIPGLGQILNQHLKKGLIILGLVFILFIAGTVELALIINDLSKEQIVNRLDSGVIMEKIQAKDIFVLKIIIVAFAIVWLYSVIDAFRTGKKIDKMTKDESI